jgi:hypothetical protein
MILRRLSEHVKSQNWFAVALDFLIVVLGVFVGLQVQEWSAERAQAIQHARYYERLQADFTTIDARIDAHLAVFNQSIESMAYVLELVRLPDLASAEAATDPARLKVALANLGARRVPPGRSATYSEMLAAGQLSRIRNSTLRDKLAQYDRLSDIHLEVYRSASDLMASQVPITYRHMQIDTIPDESDFSGISRVVHSYDLPGMRSDPEFETALEVLDGSTRNNLGVRLIEKQLTEEILALLRTETAR